MPSLKPKQPAFPSSKAKFPTLAKTSPRPQQRYELPAIRDLPSFIKGHRLSNDQITKYLSTPKPRQRLSEEIIRELDPSEEQFLHANNTESRITFAKIVVAHAESIIRLAGKGDLFWVTLFPREYAMRESEAATFNPRSLQAWVRQVLPGCHLIGMIDAALFGNWPLMPTQPDRTVCWHAHLIAWGTSAARLQRDLEAINTRYRSMIAGVLPAFGKRVTPKKLTSKLLYAAKAPMRETRVWPVMEEVFDRETGVITKVPTGRYRRRKRPLRPGDRVRMCRVMAGRYLYQLAFAAGDGAEVLAAIRDEALRPSRRWEEAQPWHRARQRADRQRRRINRNRATPKPKPETSAPQVPAASRPLVQARDAVQKLVATLDRIARGARTRLAQDRRTGHSKRRPLRKRTIPAASA